MGKPEELAQAMEDGQLKVYAPNGDMVDVTVEQLEALVERTGRITHVTLTGERNVNKGNYETEKYEHGATLNFEWFWDLVPPQAMSLPKTSKMVQRAFANGAIKSIGMAYRDIYVNLLYCVASRVRQHKLPQQQAILGELRQLNSEGTFDPFGVVEKS